MKKILVLVFLMIGWRVDAKSQQIDSIFFNLYTDSLKKGTHNYINVDGKTATGRWLPMTEKDVVFTSSSFRFSGNELIVPADCAEQKVVIRAALKSSPAVSIERTIWIKQLPDPELPAEPDGKSKVPSRRGRRS